MSRTGSWWAVLAFVAFVAIGCSETQGTTPPSGGSAAQPGAGGAGANLSDDEFVRDVALKNMSAVALSRIALNRTTHPDVKSFAQEMIDDHEADGRSLKSVVSGQPIQWPQQLDEKHSKAVDELAKAQSADFDATYVKAMVEGHQDLTGKLESRLDLQSLSDWKTAAAARTERKELPEPTTSMRDVKVRPVKSANEITMKINQWAADTYPIAQKHLDTARALETATKTRQSN